MNIYTWFYIFNATEFNATGLISRIYPLILDGVGLGDIMVTKGNYLSIKYDDVFLPIAMSAKSPFEFEGYAVYKDASENVWLGILVEDEE